MSSTYFVDSVYVINKMGMTHLKMIFCTHYWLTCVWLTNRN